MNSRWLTVTLLLFRAACAVAQSEGAKEPIGIFEVGAAPGWSITGAGSHISPTVAFEFSPIENWLEIEIGTTPTFARHRTDWDTDFLFKKPWTLSRKMEFMAGAGPTWTHTAENQVATNSVGCEVVLDFMFWPTVKRRFGWYFEPAYEYSFGKGREQSIGFSFGLLIAVRR
jgi:hypothetical protein